MVKQLRFDVSNGRANFGAIPKKKFQVTEILGSWLGHLCGGYLISADDCGSNSSIINSWRIICIKVKGREWILIVNICTKLGSRLYKKILRKFSLSNPEGNGKRDRISRKRLQLKFLFELMKCTVGVELFFYRYDFFKCENVHRSELGNFENVWFLERDVLGEVCLTLPEVFCLYLEFSEFLFLNIFLWLITSRHEWFDRVRISLGFRRTSKNIVQVTPVCIASAEKVFLVKRHWEYSRECCTGRREFPAGERLYGIIIIYAFSISFPRRCGRRRRAERSPPINLMTIVGNRRFLLEQEVSGGSKTFIKSVISLTLQIPSFVPAPKMRTKTN